MSTKRVHLATEKGGRSRCRYTSRPSIRVLFVSLEEFKATPEESGLVVGRKVLQLVCQVTQKLAVRVAHRVDCPVIGLEQQERNDGMETD